MKKKITEMVLINYNLILFIDFKKNIEAEIPKVRKMMNKKIR